MPASFTYYFKVSDTKQTPIFLYESPNYEIYKRSFPIYNSDNLETSVIIGNYTVIYTSILNENEDLITTSQAFTKFFENSGVPYGDNNILVTNITRVNKVFNRVVADGVYQFKMNGSLSSGEYANQIGYDTYIKDSTKIFASHTIYFPLPVVTYTNAFNSLPQPSTAPLPN